MTGSCLYNVSFSVHSTKIIGCARKEENVTCNQVINQKIGLDSLMSELADKDFNFDKHVTVFGRDTFTG